MRATSLPFSEALRETGRGVGKGRKERIACGGGLLLLLFKNKGECLTPWLCGHFFIHFTPKRGPVCSQIAFHYTVSKLIIALTSHMETI